MKENRHSEVLFVYAEGARTEVKASEGKVFKFSMVDGRLIATEVPINGTNSVLSTEENEYKKDVYSQLPSVSAGEYAEVLSVYTDNDGNKAVVPQGWTVSGVPSENVIWGKDMGLVIYYIPKKKVSGIDWKNKNKVNGLMETYDQLVWKPVNMLSATSTLDGIHFNEKFGRMNYRNEEFSESEYNEPLVRELAETKESIDTYGGCYITRYKISRDKKTGEPRSIKGADPWTKIDFPTAKNVAATMSKSENLMGHLTYGAEYDTRLKWTIETGTVTKKEITKDSTRLGNYYNNNNYPKEIVKTGEDGCVNNIYGFAGNVDEWTQERNKSLYRVIRGGNYRDDGSIYPVAFRTCNFPNTYFVNTGFRATLCIK